jgi:hypothetical protein
MAGPINWFVNGSHTNVVVSNTNNPWWGRILAADGEGDNLITYTERPGLGTCIAFHPIIKVAKSNDMATWTEIASIPSPTWHFQEQSQMVELPDGTILMTMRNVQIDSNIIDNNCPPTGFDLPIMKSTDGGYTWNYVSDLDSNPNGHGIVTWAPYSTGLWEPFLYVLPDGRIAGFYANEKHADDNPSYSQTISERISSDGGHTWGPEIYAAAQPGPAIGGARPGMPGFARMANGQYILVFEVCGIDPNPDICNIHYKISNDGIMWSNDLGTLIPDQVSAPFVCVLSTGRILVTSSNTNQISISDDNAAPNSWYLNDPPAWNDPNARDTCPSIYQTQSNEVGVVVNLDGAIRINYGGF